MSGHTLDLIITRCSDSIVDEKISIDHFISDHACVNYNFQAPKPIAPTRKIAHRKLKSVDSDVLKCDVAATELCTNNQDASNHLPPAELDLVVQEYHSTLTSLLDRHAPLKTKTLKTRPLDFQQFKTLKNHVTFILNEAKDHTSPTSSEKTAKTMQNCLDLPIISLLTPKDELCFPNYPDVIQG